MTNKYTSKCKSPGEGTYIISNEEAEIFELVVGEEELNKRIEELLKNKNYDFVLDIYKRVVPSRQERFTNLAGQYRFNEVAADLNRKGLRLTFQNIANELDTSRQRAHQLFSDFMPRKNWYVQRYKSVIDQMKSHDLSSLYLKQIYEIYGQKHNLSDLTIKKILEASDIPHRKSKSKVSRVIQALNAIDPTMIAVCEFTDVNLPKEVCVQATKHYIYNANFRTKHGLIFKAKAKSSNT